MYLLTSRKLEQICEHPLSALWSCVGDHGEITGLTRFTREVLLGITGKDFVILAASKAAMRGPTIIKAEDDKTRQLNKHTLMAHSGEAGDTGG